MFTDGRNADRTVDSEAGASPADMCRRTILAPATGALVDALEASRSYEANVGIIEVSKNLTENTLRIIA